mgnify:CR=1 FL=1
MLRDAAPAELFAAIPQLIPQLEQVIDGGAAMVEHPHGKDGVEGAQLR